MVSLAAVSHGTPPNKRSISHRDGFSDVCPGGMHQLGVDEDLLYLQLGAVAAHVFLLERLSEAGPPLQAVDDVLKDLMLALRLRTFSGATDQRLPERSLLGHRYPHLLLLLQAAPEPYPYLRPR